MNSKLAVWLKGLASASISGAANGITVLVVAPETFNLNDGIGKLGMVVVVGGIVGAAAYLKQSPLPVE